MIHALPAHILQRRTIRVAVIGCGGNGSVIAMGLPYIHQALLVAGHPGGLEVTLIDGDTVSATNCARQPFSQSEVGLHKSIVLASRINLFWGLRWKAIAALVAKGMGVEEAEFVIGCVDTRAARATIHALVTGTATTSYWLDLGNGADGGQFILGQPRNRTNRRNKSRLRTVTELYPEIADPSLTEDVTPSCSVTEALSRQEPFLNQVLASHALALIARFFRWGGLAQQGAFANIAAGRMTPLVMTR